MRIRTLATMLLIAGTTLFAACATPSEKKEKPQRPVSVDVLTAAYAQVPAAIDAPGSVQPRTRAVISSQINGFVREVRVRSGDRVRTGQVLAVLDAREAETRKAAAQAAIEEARAALEEARKSEDVAKSMLTAAKASADLARGTFGRYQELFEKNSVSPQEFDEVRARRDATAADLKAKQTMVEAASDRLLQVQARIDQAEAESRRADVVLSWTVVKAPSSGRIVERPVDPGSAIFPGSPLLTLESTERPQVVATLPSNQSGDLRTGLVVQVRDPLTSASVSGKVSEITPVSDPGTHTVRFKVDLPADFIAPAGRFVRVSVPAGERKALLVPRRAFREMGQLTGLFVVDGSSTARLRLVKATDYDGDSMELLAGLDPGERVIADPSGRITDGTPVEVRR